MKPMHRKHIMQATALAVILIVVLNMVLFALKKISTFYFWTVIVIAALFAYKVLPWLRKTESFK
jgi:hypothetical protein